MTNVDNHPPGHFCWVELATTNLAAAKTFYGKIFGWTTSEAPAGDMGTYTIAHVQDRDLGGMYTLMDEQVQMGVPPHWMIYVSVEDCAATVARAKELGATVHVDTTRVMDRGIFAVLQSQSGETFSIWQSLERKGNHIKDVPGSVSWTELMTKDLAGSRSFYGDLFGWTLTDMPMQDAQGKSFEYTIIQDGTEPLGGMMQMGPEFGPVPSHWMVYFVVEDTDATAAKIAEHGGSICVPPTDIPVGRFAVVNDPAGATFSIIKLNQS